MRRAPQHYVCCWHDHVCSLRIHRLHSCTRTSKDTVACFEVTCPRISRAGKAGAATCIRWFWLAGAAQGRIGKRLEW